MRRCSAGTLRQCTFNWPVLRDNVLAEVGRLEGLYEQTLGTNKVEIFHERAELAGPNEVRLASGRTVSADKILIATGARPFMPPIEGIEHAISSNEVFHLETMPKRIVIAGGRLYRQRVRRDLPPVRGARDAGQSLRRDPARL